MSNPSSPNPSSLRSFLDMTRDASFSFTSTATGNPLAPTGPAPVTAESLAASATAAGQNQHGVNLALGGVSLQMERPDGIAGDALDAARDGLRDLFGRVRKGVDGRLAL